MKKYIYSILLLVLIPFTAFAYTTFYSSQVGTSPSNGSILQSDGTNSAWLATSTLYSTPFPNKTIAFWGDSITAGSYQMDCCGDAYASWDSRTFPANVQVLSGIGVYNGGVGGDYSAGIASRFLAHPEYWNQPTVIWSGRNDNWEPTVVKASIASMVAKLTSQPYIIFGILNASGEPIGSGGYNQIVQLNSDLAALYPNNFWDARAWFNGICLPGGLYYSTLCTAQDKIDSSNGLTPGSFRNDTIHPNSLGDYVFAKYFVANILPKLEANNNNASLVTYDKLQTIFSAPPVIGSGTSTTGFFSTVTINPIRTSAGSVLAQSAILGTTTGTFGQDSQYQVLTINGRKSQAGVNGVNYMTTDFAKDTTSWSIPIIKINDSTGTSTLEIRGLSSGLQDTLIGVAAGRNITTGVADTYYGVGAGENTTTGSQNTFMGQLAGASNGAGYANTYIGYQVAPYVDGYYNTIIGDEANMQGGSSYNTVIGNGAGANLTASYRDLLLGQNAGLLPGVTTENNFMSVDNAIFGTGMDGWQGIPTTGNIGIATSTPIARLTVAGSPVAGVDAFTVASTTGNRLFTVSTDDKIVLNATTTLTSGASYGGQAVCYVSGTNGGLGHQTYAQLAAGICVPN